MHMRHAVYLAYLHTLSFALLSIGVILLVDNPRFADQFSGTTVLLPSGAPIAILVGLALLAAVYRSRCAALLSASILITIALYSLVQYLPGGPPLPETVPLPDFSPIGYSLALVLILLATAVLRHSRRPRGETAGRIIGAVIVIIGAASLLSVTGGRQDFLNAARLGSGSETAFNTSVLVVMLGIGVLMLSTTRKSSPQRLDRSTLLAGVLGTVTTCLGWHMMHLHNAEATRGQSATLLSGVQHMIEQQRESNVELIQRIAERWTALDQLPLGALWRQEAESHLRDFANLELIGIMDGQLQPTAIVARGIESRAWLHHFLRSPECQKWLRHAMADDESHMSRSMKRGTEKPAALIVAPLRLPSRGTWLIIASTDIEALIAPHANTGRGNLIVRVTEDDRILFESEPSRDSLVPIGGVTVDYHHDLSWRVETYLDSRGTLRRSAFFPPLILLFGLGLTFLLMVSQRLGWLSSERSRRLDEANLGLNASLAQQSRLKAANERIMRFSRDMLCSFDKHGRCAQVSPACRDVLGYEPEELIDQSFSHYIIPEDLAETRAAVISVMKDDVGAINFRNRYIRKDGSIAHIMWSAGWSEEEQELLCVGRDVTLLVHAEGLLSESEQRYRSLFTFNPDPVYSLDLEGRFQSLNQAGLDLLGYAESELLGRDFPFLLRLEEFPKVNSHFNQALEGRPQRYEAQVQSRGGEVFDLDITNLPIIVDDQVVGVFGVAKDVTARNRMTRAVRERDQFFTLSLDIFCTVDFQGRLIQVNPAFTRVLGFAAEDLADRRYTDLLIKDDSATVQCAVERLRQGHQIHNLEIQALDNNAVQHWLELSATTGGDDIIYCAARDISQRKLTEEKLKNTLEDLARSNQELENFAFVASHDLQEPLRKIQAFGERLRSRTENLDDQSRDYLERMESAAERMQTLIRDLLSYSRTTTRKQPFIAVDLNQILDEVLDDLETALRESAATVTQDTLPSVQGDPTQIRQVFQNLLSNAVKFCKKDVPPRIRVYAENEGSEAWTLCIGDNGIGFDERYLDRIFDPFQRLHSRQSYPGTGIGLAIVEKILERHGATITAASTPGAGTTFRIVFNKKSAQRGTRL